MPHPLLIRNTSSRNGVAVSLRHQAFQRSFCFAVCFCASPISACLAQNGLAPTIEIFEIVTPGTVGFSTYIFEVVPANGAAVTTLEGRFSTNIAGSMRQVHPLGLETVFEDHNGAMENIGEHPLADSQFEFHTQDVDLAVNASKVTLE